MTEAEMVEILGPPDEITDHPRMLGTEWKCWTCVEVVRSDTSIPVPAPCPRCGVSKLRWLTLVPGSNGMSAEFPYWEVAAVRALEGRCVHAVALPLLPTGCVSEQKAARVEGEFAGQ